MRSVFRRGRLVKITDSSDVSQVEYEYDGMNRRIRKTDTAADPDVDYDYYYNESWQLLEVRKDQDTDPLKQHVWHDYYIDALAVTWYDDDVDGADVEELYFTHDANFNVTALVDDTGAVQERYEYETYGHPAILDSDFSDDGDGLSDWEHEILFAGYQYDPDAAVYHVRNRVYQPALGRWVQRDPAGYVDGSGTYEYTSSTPNRAYDPTGLSVIFVPCAGNRYGPCGANKCETGIVVDTSNLSQPHYVIQRLYYTASCESCIFQVNSSITFEAWENFGLVRPRSGFVPIGCDTFSISGIQECKGTHSLNGAIRLIPASAFTTIGFPPTTIPPLTPMPAQGTCCGKHKAFNINVLAGVNHADPNPPWWNAGTGRTRQHYCMAAWDCCWCLNRKCKTTYLRDCVPFGPGPCP